MEKLELLKAFELPKVDFGDLTSIDNSVFKGAVMKKEEKLKLVSFDASDYLDNEETIAEHLSASLENPDPDAFLMAVRDVAKAKGISAVARTAGLGRESLYKALRPGAQPRFSTVKRLLNALGVKLDVVSASTHA